MQKTNLVLVGAVEPLPTSSSSSTSSLPAASSRTKAEPEGTAAAAAALARALAASQYAGDDLDADIAAALAVRCTRELANRAVKRLISFYPATEMSHSGGYSLALEELFMAYPAALVQRAVDPAHGIASDGRFFPSVGDCSTWLKGIHDELKAKRNRYRIPRYRRERESKPAPDPRQLKSEEERRQFVRGVLGHNVDPKAHQLAGRAQRTDFAAEYQAMLLEGAKR